MKDMAVIVLVESKEGKIHTCHLFGDTDSNVYEIAQMFLDRIQMLEKESNGNTFEKN